MLENQPDKNRGVFMTGLPQKRGPKVGDNFIQTPRKTHEEWARLTLRSPSAAALLHVLTWRVGEHNAVVASYQTLADLMGVSAMTVRRAVEVLRTGLWIEVRRIGGAGTTNAYVLNDRVAWHTARDNLRYSLFSATVIASESEQPDRDELGQQAPLNRIPRLFPGEQQMPFGDGLPPPSEPPLPGMELDLPALVERERGHGDEPVAVGQIIAGLGLKGDT